MAHRQNALEQANQLRTQLNQMLPAENAQYEQQRQSVNHVIPFIQREKVRIKPLLQDVVFGDITNTDAGVIALNEWNTVLREALELLQIAQTRLEAVELKQYKVYSELQEFIFELHKVVSRIIFRLGEISVRD
jgi:cell shape-determining protein MreC